MGASLNVEFNKKVTPYGVLSADHYALGNALDRLDKELAKAGLVVLSDFVSMGPSEWEDMDPDDPDASALPPLQWFAPSDGLAAVRAAISHLQAKPRAIAGAADVLADLEQVETELAAAEKKKAKFHFMICD